MAADTPRGDPIVNVADVGMDETRLAELLKDPARRGSVVVRLSINGGVAEERFELDLKATGDGDVEVSLDDAMHQRRFERTRLRMHEGRMGEIIKTLEPLDLARTVQRTGGFPPCSLIGRLEVAIGDQLTTTYFMADPEQAKTAGFDMSPALSRAVDMLYDEAEQSLGVGRLRP